MTDATYIQAARGALDECMQSDSRVVVLGEDVSAGGPFGLTKGLIDTYGAGRVRNTPISEGAVMGAAIGLAIGGFRPIVDLMFCDFVTAASDQLFNHAAKIHFMSGGRVAVPMTVWTLAGAGTRWGAQHSQHLEGWLAQVPGLKVLAPASPTDAAMAITEGLADPDPVVIVADRALLYSRNGLPADGSSLWNSRLVCSGNDLTIATSGRLVHVALEVLANLGTSADVVSLTRIAPLDADLVIRSVERTSRLLVLHDEASCGSYAAQLAATVSERAFYHLDAPIARLTSPATPVPAAAGLEDSFVVNADDVAGAIKRLVEA